MPGAADPGEVTVSLGRRRNIFCLFGGGDEGAAARIQGVTLAGRCWTRLF